MLAQQARLINQTIAGEVDQAIEQSGWPRIPRPFQELTVDYLLAKLASDGKHGAIITHAPGLGKTLCASLAAVRARHPNTGILVMCPPHLMRMWWRHIDRQHPDDSISLCSAKDDTGRTSNKSERLSVLVPGYDWYIINYQALRRDDYFNAVMALPISVIICDESHNLKNDQAKQSKNVYKIAHKPGVEYRWLLSATPIKKEADDLFFQFHIVDPEMFHSKRYFLNMYCNADYTQYGARNVRLKEHYKRAFQYVNPRTKCDNPEAITYGQPYTMSRRWWDWEKKRYVTDPTVPSCLTDDCCPPYELNTERTEEVIPPPPPPAQQKLNITLAGWLHDVASVERLETVANMRQRKPIQFKSEYVAPPPTVIVHESGPARNGYLCGFSYKDVKQFLPDVVPAEITIQLDTSTREMYDSVVSSYMVTLPDLETIDLGNAMSALHTMRVLTCCDDKIDALRNAIEDAPEGEGHVVFFAYDMTAELVAKRLGIPNDPNHRNSKGEPKPRYIAGHIDPDSRDAYAEQLARDGYPIIATLGSMSEGVDVSYARFVHFFEEDWTPGVMYQALSRVQRERAKEKDGVAPIDPQLDLIVCNYYLCESTIDTSVHNINQNRAMNARDVLRVVLAEAKQK